MTTEGMIRGFFAFLFAAILAWGIWQRSDGDLDFGFINTEAKRRLCGKHNVFHHKIPRKRTFNT